VRPAATAGAFNQQQLRQQRRWMRLVPREIDHLMLANAGALAQRRLARGLKLNLPEAVALISSQMMERIRDGYDVYQLMLIGRQLLGKRQVSTIDIDRHSLALVWCQPRRHAEPFFA